MATAHEPQRVSAADFIRGFANWRMQAARKPVVVTHHGKDAHVLISLDDYRRLDGETDGGAGQLRDSQADLLESIRDAVILIDRQWRIASINPAAGDMLEIAGSALVGQSLTAAVPGIESSLLQQRIVRMIDHRERFSGDIPGLVRPRQWLHVDLVPLPVGGALVLRDISDAMADHAAAAEQQALMAALDAGGCIGHARLSVREAVEDASTVLTAMVGVEAAAIRRVRFSALLATAHRQPFAEALESVFRSGVPVRLASQLVTREGAALDITLAIAELRGAYASDGALVLAMPHQPD